MPFLASRLLVLVVAIGTVAFLPVIAEDRARYDVPALTQPFSGWPAEDAFQVVFEPLARWDAVYYLAVAAEGYVADDPALRRPWLRPAFWPAYPSLVRVVSGLAPSYGAVLIAGYAVALAALFGAMMLLYRLTELELGERAARAAVVMMAVFPTSLYFGAPYTESLTVLLSLGAVYAARTGRWAVAGVLLGGASACRPPGFLVVVPLAMLYLYGPRADREPPPSRADGGWRRLLPRYRPRPDMLWLALGALGPLAFTLWLEASLGDGARWLTIQASAEYERQATFPPVAMWEGVLAAVDAVADALAGRTADALDVVNLGFLALGLIAGLAMLRELPPAYGTFVLVSILPPLSSMSKQLPLMSLPRYVALAFPIYMWLGLLASRRRALVPMAAASALLLVYFTGKFTGWAFVG